MVCYLAKRVDLNSKQVVLLQIQGLPTHTVSRMNIAKEV
jgi:hypothetical protein